MATLDELEKQQGTGWTAGTPVPKLDSQGQPVAGVYTVVLTGPEGASRVATIYAPAPPGPTQLTNLIETDPRKATFDTMAVEDTIKPPTRTPAETNANIAQAEAAAETSRAQAEVARANLEKLKQDQKQREANDAANKGYFTNAELADFDQKAKDQGLTQQQIDIQRTIASNNNKNTEISNQIAAQNAAVAAQNAAINDKAVSARIKYEEAQVDDAARQRLLDEAKFARDNADKDIANNLAQSKLELEQLTQKQANENARQQNVLRGQELAQRQAEAQQTAQTAAQTAATTAAASVYGTERQAQGQAAQTGQSLLANRMTAANNLLNTITGNAAALAQGSAGRFGMLGGGLRAVPPGLGPGLISGVMGTTAEAYGGQDTLNAAARMVQQAGADLTTPMAQAAVGVLQQVFERQHQLTGQPAAPVVAQTAARQTQQNNGFTSPAMVSPQDLATRAAAAQEAAARGAVAQAMSPPAYGPASPIGNVPGPWPQFAAPTTAPAPTTVNINV